MTKPRWRKIIKVTEPHAVKLLRTCFHNEHAKAVYGVTIMSEKREMELLNTLNQYANIIDRTVKVEPYSLKKDWLSETLNFGD